MKNIDKRIAVASLVDRSPLGPLKPRELEPTFPLDVEKVGRLRGLAIADSPKLLVWHLLAQLGSRFTLLSRFSETWSKIEPELNAAVVEHVVRQSNIAQDQVIRCLVDVLKDKGRHHYAETVTSFLRAKQSIELALKTNRRLAAQRADVETIVDSIMQEVCNEVFVVSGWEDELTSLLKSEASEDRIESLRAAIERARHRISQAYDTMIETEEQVTYQQPPAAVDDWTDETRMAESDVLDKLIGALRDENEFVRSVNGRVDEELPEVE